MTVKVVTLIYSDEATIWEWITDNPVRRLHKFHTLDWKLVMQYDDYECENNNKNTYLREHELSD